MSKPRLIIASNNAGKVSEFRELLGDCGWEVVSAAALGLNIEVDETGTTYAENARLKAEAFSRAAGLPALADDSGLEVDALNGEPGALHHVNGWDGTDRADRIAILLRALEGTPPEERTARFRAVLCLHLPGGERVEEEGVCEGVITEGPRGEGGFGYDPVFYLQERGITMAELSETEKNAISHRGVAARRMAQRLRALA